MTETTAPAPLPETLRRRRGHAFYPTSAQADDIPTMYATEAVPLTDKIIHLHYFTAGMDWWLAEYDPATGFAFGYVCLGAPDCAEWGELHLPEVEAVDVYGLYVVERDLDWTPKAASALELPGRPY